MKPLYIGNKIICNYCNSVPIVRVLNSNGNVEEREDTTYS